MLLLLLLPLLLLLMLLLLFPLLVLLHAPPPALSRPALPPSMLGSIWWLANPKVASAVRGRQTAGTCGWP
jgi:hypothetical protein